jgi:hypothetical protein
MLLHLLVTLFEKQCIQNFKEILKNRKIKNPIGADPIKQIVQFYTGNIKLKKTHKFPDALPS